MATLPNKKEDWMQAKWRPAMGWLYMATCAFDFVIFPVLWSVLQAFMKHPITQWNPLTLQGAGLYHLAMGAVLGVAAWSRGQEKLAGLTGSSPNGSPPSGGFGGSSTPNNSFGSNTSSGSWGTSNNNSFGQSSSGNSWGAQPQAQNTSSAGWGANKFSPPAPTYSAPMPEPLPAPPTKPGVRLSENPTARVVLPEDPNDDADSKIK